MDGFYSIWSRPYLERKNTNEFYMHDYELLTFVLSVLVWQKHNGNASLYADKEAIRYIDGFGILELFNGNVEELKVSAAVNPKIFWAGGKLAALRMLNRPSVMIDLDLIIWKNLDSIFRDKDIVVIHREELTEKIYPDYEGFKMKEGYSWDKKYNKAIKPCNTAMLSIKDLDFVKAYCEEAMHFMNNCIETEDYLRPMVFAEQRLISIMAELYSKEIYSFYEDGSMIGAQDCFTHLWGHKNILRCNPIERNNFNKRILDRLVNDFSEEYELLMKNRRFCSYVCKEI